MTPCSAIHLFPSWHCTMHNTGPKGNGQNWSVIKSSFMSQMCLQGRKLWGCFPLCTTGELLFIAVAHYPHQGDPMPYTMSGKNVLYADKEMFGSCWTFSRVGHNECPDGRFIFFISISVSLRFLQHWNTLFPREQRWRVDYKCHS